MFVDGNFVTASNLIIKITHHVVSAILYKDLSQQPCTVIVIVVECLCEDLVRFLAFLCQIMIILCLKTICFMDQIYRMPFLICRYTDYTLSVKFMYVYSACSVH